MTGFGAADAALAHDSLRVELRSVNHRHLDVRVRLPSELSELGHVVEEVVRARCVRGRIEAQVLWRSGRDGSAELDLERARRTYTALLKLRDELAPSDPVPFTALLSLPGLLATRVFAREDVGRVLEAATDRAVTDLLAMRAREGEALALDLRTRLSILRKEAQGILALRPEVLDAAQKRLIKRLDKLLEGTGITPDPARVVQEAAWFAERCDVAEELTRLSSHLDEFERTLAFPGESIGRKLDFMLQEIGRELNTLGAKANDAEISRRVVEMKAELERIREQVQNIL